ncbi:DUF6544 family protein [Erythrobacter sp.]|uniref:DUF6920 family protein n=1 Tax=Erythrobacter sp. TaxID=1042 RepID=UPI001425D9EA|nr:DUF6544 family protein [Erythrobacter sp.]QIQ87664.1 MAG: hypothetical protein G9473_13945 [Erythrobacter sp.]
MPAPLPPVVAALAERLGARAGSGGRAVFRQSGTLRGLGAARWMRFTAEQWIASDAPAFRWRARVGPLGLVHVEDSLVGGETVSGARALGLVPLARAHPSRELVEGQLQRYLAELPWNPDAMLSNPALRWEEKGAGVLAVSAQAAGVEAEVELHCGEDGLPARTFALRPAREGKGYVRRGWHGAFADYREAHGRMIPHAGRVAWDYEGERFEVWRGRIEDWRPGR